MWNVAFFMVFFVFFVFFVFLRVVFLMMMRVGVGHVMVRSLHQRWLDVGDELGHVTCDCHSTFPPALVVKTPETTLIEY